MIKLKAFQIQVTKPVLWCQWQCCICGSKPCCSFLQGSFHVDSDHARDCLYCHYPSHPLDQKNDASLLFCQQLLTVHRARKGPRTSSESDDALGHWWTKCCLCSHDGCISDSSLMYRSPMDKAVPVHYPSRFADILGTNQSECFAGLAYCPGRPNTGMNRYFLQRVALLARVEGTSELNALSFISLA